MKLVTGNPPGANRMLSGLKEGGRKAGPHSGCHQRKKVRGGEKKHLKETDIPKLNFSTT